MTEWTEIEASGAEAEIFERIVIAGKNVYVVDDHHKALGAPKLVQRGLKRITKALHQ
jgi:hypothetical protein